MDSLIKRVKLKKWAGCRINNKVRGCQMKRERQTLALDVNGSCNQLSIIFRLTADSQSALWQHIPVDVFHCVVALVSLRDSLSHPDLPALLQPPSAGVAGLGVCSFPKHNWHGLCWSTTGRKLQQWSIFRNVLLKGFPIVPLVWCYAICSSIKHRHISAKLIKYYHELVGLKYLKLSTGPSHMWIQMTVWYYNVPDRSPSPLSGLASYLWSV